MRIPGIQLRDAYQSPDAVSREVRRRKNWLLANGDRFLLRAQTSLDTIYWILAALEAHVILAPIHPESTAREKERFQEILGDFFEIRDFPEKELGELSPKPAPPDRIAVILFSSGSTGAPKAVALTEENLRSSARAHAEHHALSREDIWLSSLPFFHVGGFSIVSRAYYLEQDIAFAQKSSAEEALFWMGSGLVSGISLVPTQLWRILEETPKPKCLAKLLLLGGAALPPSIRERALSAGLPIKPSYGLTESASQVMAGVALPGVECRLSQDGEIYLRGKMISPGYWYRGNVQSNRDENDFFPTGDLGEQSAEGYTIFGRKGDLIISGGENIFPAEVEDALLSLPGVLDAAVVGVPNEEWGKIVCALVVLRDNLPRLSADEIRAILRHRLLSWKIPKRILFTDSIPRNAMKKIIRQEVLKQFLS